MVKSQHHYSKSRLISTSIYPLTLPTRLYSSQESSTVSSSEFSLCSDANDQILRTKVFLYGYKHEATKVTKLNPSSSKPLPMRNVNLDHLTKQTMITLRSYSTPPSTPMTHHHIKLNRHGATPLHPLNITCPYLTCATRNPKKNATFSI